AGRHRFLHKVAARSKIAKAVTTVGSRRGSRHGRAATVHVQVNRHATLTKDRKGDVYGDDVDVLGGADLDVLEVIESVARLIGAAGVGDRVAVIRAGLRRAGRHRFLHKVAARSKIAKAVTTVGSRRGSRYGRAATVQVQVDRHATLT